MVNIELGEVIFGGVGSGLYGMLMFAILAVFIAGLMVGRTPEYLGKKIEQKEVKMVMLAVLVLAIQHPRLLRARASVSNYCQRAAWAITGRTAFPRFCTPTPARPATTAARSAESTRTRRISIPPSGSPCCSAAS